MRSAIGRVRALRFVTAKGATNTSVHNSCTRPFDRLKMQFCSRSHWAVAIRNRAGALAMAGSCPLLRLLNPKTRRATLSESLACVCAVSPTAA